MKEMAPNLNHFSFLFLKEQIRLNIAITAGFLVIEMQNDYKEKPVVKNNHFESEREQDSLAHGVGMSQNGAKNMALQGLGAEQILNFFYEGCEICSEQ